MAVNFIVKKNNADRALREADQALEAALLAVGLQAEGYAKKELNNTPKRIDTGLLRNSITYAYTGKEPAIKHYKGDNPSKYNSSAPIPEGEYSGQAPKVHQPTVFIGTNVEYATYVHDGTSRMKANRFLRNAVAKHGDIFQRIVKKYLQNN